jgi:hypothetical protein
MGEGEIRMPIIKGVGSLGWNRTAYDAILDEVIPIAAGSIPPIMKRGDGRHSLGFQLQLDARQSGKDETYVESLEYEGGIFLGAEYLYEERDTETFPLKEEDSIVSASLGWALRRLTVDTGAHVCVLYDAAGNFLNIDVEGYHGPVDRPDALLAELSEKMNRWVGEGGQRVR